MATIELTEHNIGETIDKSAMVLVDWWASWCGPCRSFAPVYETASANHPDIVFAKIDTEAQQELAASANIRSIPTLMAFREGVLLFSQPGALPLEALEDLIGQLRAVDMDEVRRQIADHDHDCDHEGHDHQH